MASTDASQGDPTRLPPGTRVGPWELREWRGRGSYGTVYRAVRRGNPDVAEVALKLASHSEDPRFAREVALLSRLRHPNVPRLFDQGAWLNAAGRAHPYLVMEWVDGISLYAWAARHAPTSRQVLRVLSQVASALAQTVEVGAVHRDVKGDNILVRGGAEGHAFLMDYGSGYYAGAERLTPPLFPPATPRYRSPEAWAYAQRAGLDAERPYEVQPADDVFALGVSAYRLVTGTYPPSTEPWDTASQVWSQDGVGPRSPQELNPRVAPHLSSLILCMLSSKPEHRATPSELAKALNGATRQAGPEADQPLFAEARNESPAWPSQTMRMMPGFALPDVRMPDEREAPKKARRFGSRWWLALAAGVPVAMGVGWLLQPWLLPAEHAVAVTAKRGASSVAAADTALMAPPISGVPSGREGITLELPHKPFPGQERPDSAGKCPRKTQIAINNGCWVELKVAPDACEDGYLHKGGCYMPAFRPAPTPTSHPTTPRQAP
ncbi:serine/threonine-protein kinase [Stigmatella erecta]|uniref:Protein kinase domain-containing protein n=1 Tax=Stigmatella erecta TaxID=83460 RepID=A0A1I0KWP5_9BACT|nr:serine/threonine-protein kinase [Stigmatella erecta]SEU30661.1 Protein kinase domain-containing protein [Stigmatella erecta]